MNRYLSPAKRYLTLQRQDVEISPLPLAITQLISINLPVRRVTHSYMLACVGGAQQTLQTGTP